MTDTIDMGALVDRLEKADGPNYALECLVFKALQMPLPEEFGPILRCIMMDGEFDAHFKGARVRRRLMNAALSEWVSARTGLPIDFQFQSITEATRDYSGRPRNAMGILLRCEADQDLRDDIAPEGEGPTHPPATEDARSERK